MMIYLAARYSRRLELCGYREQLRELGHVVTSRWLDGAHQINNEGVPIGDHGEALVESGSPEAAAELRERFAVEDMIDVLAGRDLLVAFTEIPRATNSRGGRHVELGIALGAGIPVLVVGPRENVFCHLPSVRHVDSWADLAWTAAGPERAAVTRLGVG